MASPLSPPRSRAQRGSKDYELVKELPENMQCPICCELIDNPHLISCCGHHFCEDCISKIENAQIANVRNCPLCQAEFTHMLDRGKQRIVNELEVYCPNRESGCNWTGQLSSVERHLEADLSKNGCQFEELNCKHSECQQKVQRRGLEKHENEDCPYRPFSCVYCEQYNSFYKDVVENHYPVCDFLPVDCPNNCGIGSIVQSKLSEHLENNCEHAVIPCCFHIVGCKVERMRKDMVSHHKTCLKYHNEQLLTRMATMFGQVSSLEAKNAELHTLVLSLDEKHSTLQSQHDNLLNQHTDLAKCHVELEDKHSKLEEQHTLLGDQHAKLEECYTKLDDQHSKLDKSHSHLMEEHTKLSTQNAKFDERLTTLANQHVEVRDKHSELEGRHAKLEGESTQMSEQSEELVKSSKVMNTQVQDMEKRLQELPNLKAKVDQSDEELKNMKDQFDREHKALTDELKKEFVLKKQHEDELKKESEKTNTQFQDVEKRLQDLNKKVDVSSEELKNACGKEHTDLKDKLKEESAKLSTQNAELLKKEKDLLSARVENVEGQLQDLAEHKALKDIQKDVKYIEESFTPKPPFAFTVSRFNDRKGNREAFVSPPFYTKLRGYKMCIRVDICGMNDHVAVYCCIMRGEHDESLDWPFRGEVVIRLQNHLGRDNNYEQRICFDDKVSDLKAGKVQTGDKNYLHGLSQFVPYKELYLNQRKRCQYLKGDALDFEVVEVSPAGRGQQ